MSEIYDITIIGGGPVGLFAAFYANLREAKVKLIDSLEQLGGQPSILYPEKTILDLPGFPSITGQGLTENLIAQLNTFETEICLGETLLEIEHKTDHYRLVTSKAEHLSKTVIIAIGGGAFKARPLDIEGAENFDNVHYHVQNMEQFKDKKVTILGGGDSAVDWALAFEKIADTTLIHRRDNFRALEHSVTNLKASKVHIKTPYIPYGLEGKDGKATHLHVAHSKSKETHPIEVDHIFVNYGFKSSIGNLKEWDLELERNKIVVNTKLETNRPGIYAIGDCCTYPGKAAMIATGFGEAPTAINNAVHFIDPKQKVQPKHSTSM
ncbi:NAD(P)/FAD-dependent oxidoreductase [Streptococcus sp. 121]|uniref:NAD(P)/FAD-dependent oxidoreductase n=1 Tax=Streptococcus sp. 121 TaxID=2797637 RepID=UPI0018F0FAF6|nr:NAD(P)/FAD-dependent oxidoreductase [Streptococcus sp. 121]MBJ6744850.1 NAD(P)/FAD-dependent oxidoreductase [Streptococcus sp. 121]